MGKLMCYGKARVWTDAGRYKIDHWSAFMGIIPTGVKRIKMKCPDCGRKVWSSIMTCDDGCHIIHVLPPHKPKGWWKKKGKG